MSQITSTTSTSTTTSTTAIIQPTYLYEKETEVLGFTPLSFIDQSIHIINHHAHTGLDALQEYIEKQLGDSSIECEQGMQKAASLLANAIDKNFDKWELYSLQKVFALPQLEEEEEENDKTVNESDLSPEQLITMQKYLQVKSLRLRLEKELSCLRARVEIMKQSQKQLKPIVDQLVENGVKELKDTLEYGKELKSVKENTLLLDHKVSVLLDKANSFSNHEMENQVMMIKEEQLYTELQTRSKELEMMVL